MRTPFASPKRQATGSNPAGGAKNDLCKPFFDGLQRFFVIVFPERTCRSSGTILYIFRCMPANWIRTIFPALLIKNADLLIRFSRPIFRMGPTPAMRPVCWPVPATCESAHCAAHFFCGGCRPHYRNGWRKNRRYRDPRRTAQDQQNLSGSL